MLDQPHIVRIVAAGRVGGRGFDERFARARIEIRPPADFQPGVPAVLDRICLRSLEPDPERRYRTAAEFARALRRVSRGR